MTSQYFESMSDEKPLLIVAVEQLLVCPWRFSASFPYLHGELIPSIAQWGSFIDVHTEPNGTVVIGGIMKEVIDILSNKIPFRYTLVLSEDRLWGSRSSNGTFNGMFGMMQRQEIDVILGPSTISTYREEVSDFSTFLFYDFSRMVYRIPETPPNYGSLIKPFTWDMWIAVAISIGLATFLHFSTFTYSAQLHCIKSTTMFASFNQLYAMLLLQPLKYISRMNTTRIILLAWALGSSILAKSYQCILIAILTIPEQTPPIETLVDLVNQNTLPWRLELGTFLYNSMKFSESVVEQKVFEHKAGTFVDCAKNRSDIARGNYVALCDLITIKQLMTWDISETGDCRLHMGSENIRAYTMSIALAPKHPLLPKFNYWSRRILESGLIHKWNRRKDKSFICETKNRKAQAVSVTLLMFIGLFFILIGGYILSTNVFILEMIISTFKQKVPYESPTLSEEGIAYHKTQ